MLSCLVGHIWSDVVFAGGRNWFSFIDTSPIIDSAYGSSSVLLIDPYSVVVKLTVVHKHMLKQIAGAAKDITTCSVVTFLYKMKPPFALPLPLCLTSLFFSSSVETWDWCHHAKLSQTRSCISKKLGHIQIPTDQTFWNSGSHSHSMCKVVHPLNYGWTPLNDGVWLMWGVFASRLRLIKRNYTALRVKHGYFFCCGYVVTWAEVQARLLGWQFCRQFFVVVRLFNYIVTWAFSGKWGWSLVFTTWTLTGRIMLMWWTKGELKGWKEEDRKCWKKPM